MLTRFPASFTALTAVCSFLSLAQAAGDQSPDVPDAVIDLRTSAGVSLIDGQWRYTDVHITDSEFRAPGPDNKPNGPAVKTHDIHPRIGTPDFESAQWQAIQADTLESRRTNGRLAFAWYRLDFTVPEKIGDFATAGSTAVFEITVDDYAEVWVDGSLSQTVGQSGGQLVRGWNAPNRVTIARDANPGQRIQVAVFAANGPISDPPANFVWIRSATLDFYKRGRGWVNAPTPVPTEITRVDPALDAIIAPGTKAEKLADGFSFVEGPIWVPQLASQKTYGGGAGGYLLFSDPNKNVIHRWEPATGDVSIFRSKSGYTGIGGANIGEYHQPGSNGLTLSPDERLTICEHGNRRVTRLEPNGSITVLADRYEGKRLNSPNDLVYRSDGTLFFTDPPFGLPKGYDDTRKELPYSGVFCVHNGVLRLVASELKGPNGLAFSPDEKHLYVDNWDEQKKVIVRYDVAPDGTLSNATTLVDLTSVPGGIAFDGLKVDASGNIYVSAPGGLRVFSSEGKHLGTISLPEIPANFTFGDSDGRTLYMTARTRLYRIRLNVPGSSQAPTVPNPAGAPKLLRAGDAAPKVGYVEWLKGEPIDLNDRKHAYLLEFWATWCGPCVQQIPHLNDLQKKFESRGLVVVGMNSGDKEEGPSGSSCRSAGATSGPGSRTTRTGVFGASLRRRGDSTRSRCFLLSIALERSRTSITRSPTLTPSWNGCSMAHGNQARTSRPSPESR
jgi:gluconolactonase